MKIVNIILKTLLVLLLSTPILGATGVFPPPTADLYSPEGWTFMEALLNTGYILYLIAFTCAVVIVLILMKKTALAMIILTPLTVNIILFHAFIEGGIFSASAVLADMLVLLNAYFLWSNRETYKQLW